VITGEPQSTLAQAPTSPSTATCRKKPVRSTSFPTASTTAALALGRRAGDDALVTKGFRQEDFANLHPGGKLGKRLMRAGQLMHSGDQAPSVGATGRNARGDLRNLA
jgi:arabinose-5-phosphate isomerase